MSNKKSINKEELENMIEQIYTALSKEGYDPSGQLAGYILSEDPVYIPDCNNARGIVRHIDRDELLRLIIEYYFEHRFSNSDDKKDI